MAGPITISRVIHITMSGLAIADLVHPAPPAGRMITVKGESASWPRDTRSKNI